MCAIEQYRNMTAKSRAQVLLAEYDNTQSDVNHIHTVWRDPTGDSGDDVLARHHATFHAPPRPV